MNIVKISLRCILNPFSDQCYLFIPPKNVRKPSAFWHFQGVQKRNINLKWVKPSDVFKPTENIKFIQLTQLFMNGLCRNCLVSDLFQNWTTFNVHLVLIFSSMLRLVKIFWYSSVFVYSDNVKLKIVKLFWNIK